MKFEYVETFVDATVRVLGSVLNTGFERGDACLVDGKTLAGEITVSVPLAGEVQGYVTIHLSRNTATRLFNHSIGAASPVLPPLGLDYLQELGNVIAGAAASALNDMGYEVTVAPPLLAASPEVKVVLPEVEACQIPIFSEFGSMAVNIMLTTS